MSVFKTYEFFLHGLLKLVGLSPRKIEIEPGTVINVWGPTKPTKKPALVFVHGVGFDGVLTWQFQAFAFAKHYSVYLPDLLFFGGSFTDKAERSPAFQVECMAKALWKLGVDKCTVVGLSYGGMVSFKMAEMYPELVESMVASCTVMAVTESIRNAGTDRLGISDWGEFMLPDTGGLLDYKKERLELLEALQIRDNEFTVPCYKQRIHLLWGENDMLFDLGTARNMKRQIGENASLEYIEKAGHNVPLDRPFKYNSHLKKILASLSSNPKNV
ncbi:hypothetical protein V6N12_011020 [Hibiscus sabdariffa]|uniref:AB hydrolase-1 domain-containing protein n=1 Tax=Hibiscus sabdariffa TaxID=183260 RepID=A0ABR2EM47_9ROSI